MSTRPTLATRASTQQDVRAMHAEAEQSYIDAVTAGRHDDAAAWARISEALKKEVAL